MATRRGPQHASHEALAARLRSAEQAESAASRLGMQLGDNYWLLDLADVAEVIPIPEVLPVPLTQAWFAGVANIRGNLISVVDFSAFLGGPAVEPDERSRLVLIADKHRINSGLLFSRVIGLRQFDRFEREPDEAHQPSWIEGRYVDTELQHWNALHMHALVTHPDFLQVEIQFH
jgi:twitching motility protein PilI